MSTIEVKDNSKRAATQIKRLATSKAASSSDSNRFVRVPRNKRVRTGVLPNQKHQGGKLPKHDVIQRYCVLFKKAVILE